MIIESCSCRRSACWGPVVVGASCLLLISGTALPDGAGVGPPRDVAPGVPKPGRDADVIGDPPAPGGANRNHQASPGDWCATQQQYLASLDPLVASPLASACPEDGPCDDPLLRDASVPDENTPVKTIRLSIHVFCENNGGNCAATPQDVAVAVARLNTDYALWRIQFVAEWNFVNSTKYRYLDQNTETAGMKLAYADSPATKLNVYVVDTGTGACWGTFPWTAAAVAAGGGVVMHETWFAATSSIPSVLTHEVGHCLGLWHTFHGTDEVVQCSDCYEPAGRSMEEGDITGDRCSDTEPSPKNANNCFDPPGTDPCNGMPWTSTPYLNYMSYSHLCPIEFTPQQAGRMQCWTADVLAGWLDLPAPPNPPGAPTLTKIGGGQIEVAWTDNSDDEDGFRVERQKKSGGSWIDSQLFEVGADIAQITDAPGSGTFRYRVQAFNDLGDSDWSAWKQIKN